MKNTHWSRSRFAPGRRRNCTRAEVARRLGATPAAIARLEGGRSAPSIATLRRYAEATGARLTVALAPADS